MQWQGEYTMEGYHNTKMIWRLPSRVSRSTPRTDDGEVVRVDDDLEAMMSGGVLDVETKIMETRP